MSKYIRLEDAISVIQDSYLHCESKCESCEYKEYAYSNECGYMRGLSDLPTIEVSDNADRPFEYFEGYEDGRKSVEVSEGDLYIPLNNQTVKRINRLHKNECGEYFDEEWLFNELEQISEFREVSEDCISREWVIEKMLAEGNKYTNNDIKHGYHNCELIVYDSPSVVPCCNNENFNKVQQELQQAELTTEQSSMVGEWIDNHNGTFTCSKCGDKHSKSNYCSACGARMKG